MPTLLTADRPQRVDDRYLQRRGSLDPPPASTCFIPEWGEAYVDNAGPGSRPR